MKQIPLAIGVEAANCFDNFLPGANALAVAHLQALGPQSAPVYLWGPSGSGKTHLLQALVLQYQQQGAQAGWFNAEDPAPWMFDESWSLIVIDRCDELQPDPQHAAFTLFVEATTRGVPIVAAGRLPPVDLPLREDLRTRLGWGHIFELHLLTDKERQAVLRQEAVARGVQLTGEAVDFMLNRFSRDLSSLMQLLDKLDVYALQTQRAITIPLIKAMLESE